MSSEQARALELSRGLDAAPKNLERVASEVGEGMARWAFSQWDLRKRARGKFSRADEMLFERAALEMATHERLAEFHASRFQQGERIADLTCGIGGDLIGLASRGPAVGYETDAVRAAYARHNLAVHGLEGEVREEGDHDGREAWDVDSVFFDPQRRYTDDTLGEPDPRTLRGLCHTMRVVGVKLGTAADMAFLSAVVFPRVEAVSYAGECRELLSWAGEEFAEGLYAVHVESGETLEYSEDLFSTDDVGAWLFHADPAAIKARCLGTLCAKHGLAALGDSDGYLTGDAPLDSPWVRGYRVVWHGGADRKHTQAELQRLGGQIVEVKTRGVREPAERVRARFKPAGERPLVLAVWPHGKSLRHALLEPTGPPSPGSP